MEIRPETEGQRTDEDQHQGEPAFLSFTPVSEEEIAGRWQRELIRTMVANAHAGDRTGGGPFYRDSLNIPPEIKASIDGHVMSGKPTGSFVQAVLENDLKTAVLKADEANYLLLGAIIGYCCNELPVVCWGSEDAVAAWARKGGWLAIYPGEPFRMSGLKV